jgi:hypothetical protein
VWSDHGGDGVDETRRRRGRVDETDRQTDEGVDESVATPAIGHPCNRRDVGWEETVATGFDIYLLT